MANKAENRILVGILTRDRPHYLAGLLSTLLFQTHAEFDVLIVDSGNIYGESWTHVERVAAALKGTGREVDFIQSETVGYSSVVPMNRLLMEAVDRGYHWLYRVDDDHIVPPQTLEVLLSEAFRTETTHNQSVVLSGVTPWMHKVWEGASGPEDFRKQVIPEPLSTFVKNEMSGSFDMKIGHFDRYLEHRLVKTILPSSANFLIRPKVPFLWADLGPRCLWADAMWFLQLKVFLDYNFYIHTGIEAWHVVAPSGGVRKGQEDHIKGTEFEEKLRKKEMDLFLKRYWSKIYGG